MVKAVSNQATCKTRSKRAHHHHSGKWKEHGHVVTRHALLATLPIRASFGRYSPRPPAAARATEQNNQNFHAGRRCTECFDEILFEAKKGGKGQSLR